MAKTGIQKLYEATLMAERDRLSEALDEDAAWLSNNVRHPEWDNRVKAMHSREVALHTVRIRLENVRNGAPEYGHEIPDQLRTTHAKRQAPNS